MKELFTREDAWHGGFYELCFELPEASEESARKAQTRLWSAPGLEGCYLRNDIEPNAQHRVSPVDIPSQGHKYGLASFPGRKVCACGSYAADYDADGWWVDFYLPLGSLDTVYPVGAYPFADETEIPPEQWLKSVNLWLKNIAENVYEQTKFPIALIGFEVQFIEARKRVLEAMPEERWDGILLSADGKLSWYPPTVYQSQIALDKQT